MSFAKLMSAGSIGPLQTKNRIVLAAMGSNFAEADGGCGERIQAYYEERAKGGAGLLIMETAAVAWPAGSTMPNTVGLSENRFLVGLSQLAERVHRHGAKIAVQLNHGGKVAQEDIAAGRPVLVPSVPPKSRSDMLALLTPQELGNFVKAAGPDGKGPRYREMEQADIDKLIAQFVAAAERAKQSNFDGVEIHAGHGYVISSFLSPAVNKRSDQYGGSAENRARLLCEIIRAVRLKVGKDFPLIVRFDAHEYRVAGGITIKDALGTAKLAEQAGADALDVSAYGNTAIGIAFTEAPLVHQPGGFLAFAKSVKRHVGIPVIAVGRVEIDTAEKGIACGDFDYVGMGRKLLADPHLPNKIAAGRADTIRPCIYCYVCVSKIFINAAMSCAVNPDCGQEYKTDLIASSHSADMGSKRVLVIGGGPGGLEAARTLALRGHEVSLWEREKDLGGTARVAALAYEPNQRLVKHLTQAVRELPITIETGKTACVENIKAFAPDAVIVATGANRAAPAIDGKDQRHVFDGNELRGLLFGTDPVAARKLTRWQRLVVALGQISQLLRNISALRLLSKIWMPLSKRVVLLGGDLVGLELAEYLRERGREVAVIEPSANLGAELSIVRRARVVHELRDKGVTLHSGANIQRITGAGVEFEINGKPHSEQARHVIIALGAEPDTDLTEQLSSAGIHAVAVGDCQSVSYIEGAIHSGRAAALNL